MTDLKFSILKRLPILVVLIITVSCKHQETLFENISSTHSGITFTNTIIENDSVNQLDNGNIFNGGGVGIGDFNNDGLQDIYFTSSLGSNKLYLNKGGFRFEDATERAGVSGEGRWSRGVAVVDINCDGKQDIYISATIKSRPSDRKNLLYINQGLTDGTPVFKEMATEYGLADDSHSTQAAFFDYDNDGDLDMYLTVNEIADRNTPYVFRAVIKDSNGTNTGKLFRNDSNDPSGHPVFRDVSKEAGIRIEGFGNQASITDLNHDGWKDIYVTNDFISPDLLWINNGNGTFTESLAKVFRHTSNSAMGNDIADINNDGLQDIIALDMNPEDNYRKKMMLLPASYQFFQNSDRFGYVYQYTRNTLQLNQGVPPGADTSTLPVFSDISFYAGIEGTDWSWCPLLADLDNDGLKDIFIANGFARDITDRDFGTFRAKGWMTTPKADLLKQIPEVKIHNYAFKNNDGLSFNDMSQAWGFTENTFSNGAAWADFDNDGDLDLVTSNINGQASVCRNRARELNPESTHFLDVKIEGDKLNPGSLGALVEIYYNNGRKQVYENTPYRGYLSTSQNFAHFGLGETTLVDSLTVRWPNGKSLIIKNIETNKTITASETDASSGNHPAYSGNELTTLFSDVTNEKGIDYIQQEEEFIDFNIQKELPGKYSEQGPFMAAGDVNGDGFDDIITGGSSGHSAMIFFQQKNGKFLQKPLLSEKETSLKKWDDAGIALFDADGDKDPDLYIASGGYENESGSRYYADHFYLNDGKGNFTEYVDALAPDYTSKSCVSTADIDNDGDQDLFIGGKVDPWNYPKPVKSIIYRNDTQNGLIRFTDITSVAAPEMAGGAMISTALFTDFDGDGWTDLVTAGEWTPVTFYKNDHGNFKNVTQITNQANTSGWWHSLTCGDFDNDGDIDVAAGNTGLNTYYKGSAIHPVSVYASDFDNNGSYDAFPAIYLHASQQDNSMKLFPAFGRDDAVKNMISLRSRFQNYKSFALAGVDQLFTPEQLSKAQIVNAYEFRSVIFINDGKDGFTIIPLPDKAQLTSLQSLVSGDFNGDGNCDIIASTNDYSTEVLTGRYDALNGLFLEGDGKCGFRAVPMQESGIYVPGNGRGAALLKDSDGSTLIAMSENRGPLRIFKKSNISKNK